MTSSNKLLRELLFWICKRNNSSLIGQCTGHVTRFLKRFAFIRNFFDLIVLHYFWLLFYRSLTKLAGHNRKTFMARLVRILLKQAKLYLLEKYLWSNCQPANCSRTARKFTTKQSVWGHKIVAGQNTVGSKSF